MDYKTTAPCSNWAIDYFLIEKSESTDRKMICEYNAYIFSYRVACMSYSFFNSYIVNFYFAHKASVFSEFIVL